MTLGAGFPLKAWVLAPATLKSMGAAVSTTPTLTWTLLDTNRRLDAQPNTLGQMTFTDDGKLQGSDFNFQLVNGPFQCKISNKNMYF